ncbi:SGNH/GDSL hydrolase family protein [Rufibacter glacialis]|uniref:SGNH/GDSL hydrolase family protein n=1 Tax=Rufibacter glacialis TaxID=1259555 RepID=A0A5M8QH24_9BACT|nr:SGNH/GDSL hydrolase family protein [Rufibacter glacialis]KAA6435339.1 SGNH/GDSL hydrolase family protein [Rufibacter glacialis]
MRPIPRILIFVTSLFFLSACSSLDTEEEVTPSPTIPPSPGTSGSYLALGDSYTIGQGVAATERWPVHLANYLSGEGVKVGEPRIIAQTGWTTADLLQRVKSEKFDRGYELVSLMIGVNNQYQGRSLEEFRTQFRELLSLSTAIALKDPTNVFVLTIPDWGGTPFGSSRDQAYVSSQIKKFNEVIKAEAAAAGITVIDVYEVSLLVKETPSYLAPDGLHYSGFMHQRWAQMALPEAKKKLPY